MDSGREEASENSPTLARLPRAGKPGKDGPAKILSGRRVCHPRLVYELTSGMISNEFQIRDLGQAHWKSVPGVERGRG